MIDLEYDFNNIIDVGMKDYLELSAKISQAKDDPQGYIEKNFNIVNRFQDNGEEFVTVKYKDIIAHVSGNKIMEKFDIFDCISDEIYYKDITIDEIEHSTKKIKDILKHNSLSMVDIKGDGIQFFGRKDVLETIEESFYKKRMRSLILVGQAGSGKTKVIQQLAKKLCNKYVFLDWNLAEVISDSSPRGLLEGRVNQILKKIYAYNKKNERKIVLFVDEIHAIMSKGDSTDSSCLSISIQDMLKPYLTNPNMIIIGATTPREYKNTIYKDIAFRRRLNPIYLEPLPKDVVIKILRKFSDNELSNEIIEYVYDESLKVEEASNPDISIEIIDRLLAKKKMRNIEITKDIVDSILNIMKINEKLKVAMEEV